MLALQLHEMDASRPRGSMPFGYHFDTNPDYSLPAPPMPMSGPTLLDDTESNLLDNFFNGIGSESFNYDFFSGANDSSPLGHPWNDISSAFMGTNTAFGPQSSSLQTAPTPNAHPAAQMMSPPNYPISPMSPDKTEPTQDVIAAATLLHNGSNGLRSMSIGGPPPTQYDPMLSNLATRGISPYDTMNASPMQQQNVFASQAPLHTPYMFGSSHGLPILPPNPQARVLRFGSDPTFGTMTGSAMPVSPHSEPTVMGRPRIHTQPMDSYFHAIEECSTAGTSGTPSPTTLQPGMPSPGLTSPGLTMLAEGFQEVDNSRYKRRKGKFGSSDEEEDDEDDEDYFVIETSPRKSSGNSKRRSIAKPKEAPVAGGTPTSKRRKSTTAIGSAAAAKNARENLTEDQKRENHIKSEQKRRQQIKEGFDDLHELVPGLKVGGFSKSAVLTLAADWLEELLTTNAEMRQRLGTARHGR